MTTMDFTTNREEPSKEYSLTTGKSWLALLNFPSAAHSIIS